jgi:NAD-dependent dihydropyrimidine dehydrogenase PreA subunit
MHHRIAKRNSTKYIRLDTRLCQACWKCIEACPNGVIGRIEFLFHKHTFIENANKCKGCQKCVKACLQQAITSNMVISHNPEGIQ